MKRGLILFFISILILISPLLLLKFLMRVPSIVETFSNATIDGWMGFLGAYLSGVISLVGIAWQINYSKNQEENNKKQGLSEYLKYIIKKNQEDRSAKNFSIQKLVSFSNKSKEIKYSQYVPFDEAFISDNLKIIMSLNYGKEILDIFYEIKELESLIERINNYHKNDLKYFEELKKLIDILDDSGLGIKEKNNFRILELLSLIIESLNTSNSNILSDLQSSLKEKLEENLFAEIKFRDLNVTVDDIEEIINSKQIEADSIRLNEIFINLLVGINAQIFSHKKFISEYSNIYEDIMEIAIILKKMNGKSFKIARKLDIILKKI